MSAFQEYDCPSSGIDFDLSDEQILCAGEGWECSGCNATHIAGQDGPTQTAVVTPPGNEFVHEWRALPKDAAEKAAWIAESHANNALRGGSGG